MEFAGSSVAFIVVYTILFVMGSVELPDSIVTLYCGWLLLAWFSTGLALVFAGLAMEFDVMERIVPVFMYLMIPLSGAFIMASWLPSGYRDLYLLLPIPNAIEMVRDGVFGDNVPTFYHAWYMAAWSAGLCLLGLALLARSQNKLEIE